MPLFPFYGLSMFVLLFGGGALLVYSILIADSGDRVTRKKIRVIWAIVGGVIFLVWGYNWWYSKIELNKDDICGEYVIDRSQFSGKQADWQYNHFRFKITEDDRIYFYETEGKQVVRTYQGKIEIIDNVECDRFKIIMDNPHHIIADNPTFYRSNWDFYLVYNSSKFGNVFFKKGTWKAID